MMQAALLVFLGGGLGSLLRWGIGLWAAQWLGSGWPYGTFIVNTLGCFAMGLGFRLLPVAEAGQPSARLLLLTGVLGGFTTFSAFALDSALLWQRQETGGLVLYLAGTLATTLGGVALGLFLGKWLAP
jgi:CrcB protein